LSGNWRNYGKQVARTSTQAWRGFVAAARSPSPWRHLQQPGLYAIAIVLGLRALGLLQSLEWRALDYTLRLRPSEGTSERVALLTLTQDDVEALGEHPLPAAEIAALLQELERYAPHAIGLNVLRRDIDSSSSVGNSQLADTLALNKDIVAIEKVLPPLIEAPQGVPDARVGFADVLLDRDNHLRRILLGTPNPNEPNEYELALSVRLAQAYLEPRGMGLTSGRRDPAAMRFGSAELPRFTPDFGAYRSADAGGVQTLLNYRRAPQPFQSFSLRDLMEGRVDPEWIRDRAVIIGVTDPRYKNTVQTDAVGGLNSAPGLIDGVEVQAHALSQILSAALDGRPLLRALPNGVALVWIVGWGTLGMALGQRSLRSSGEFARNLGYVAIANLALATASYGAIVLGGWWLPLVPAGLVLTLNGVGLSSFSVYQFNRDLRARLDEREMVIDRTFNVMHNGPLQRLALLMRTSRDRELPRETLVEELTCLNRELRQLSEALERDLLGQEESLLLGSGHKLDLRLPAHELLYAVYSSTLERPFPGFETLRVKVRSFDPIAERTLDLERKRRVCMFLEEALCNVGKHATGATRLQAIGKERDGWYVLGVRDNGPGVQSARSGQGTKQFLALKAELKGRFRRESLQPQGTLCELSFPLATHPVWTFAWNP